MKNSDFIDLRIGIVPGVNIGDNVIIGFGSIPINDIPSDSVAAGVPAKVIRSIAEYREKIDLWLMTRSCSNAQEARAVLTRYFDRG